ncbi:hypothetical protein [Sphingomonas melonis]|uniref:Uncharacterized protein n=1 Tax=Sphingomonas melonis TaxID=152682 RepID=A0A7Y9FK43_9SPHN|nr:hypothetical protein [Sphingomonas melonis]NYD88740.1 hypothetical protein [Sphingomonas melonis]
MTAAGALAQAAVKTASGESINTGIWTLVALCVTTIGGIVLAIIKQWGPWKKNESDGRAADFERLRDEIAVLKVDHKAASDAQNNRIEKLEGLVETARRDATAASEHATRSDAKLQTALTACEVLLGLVEREMPEAKEIGLVKRLLAQAASDDLGIGSGMRKIASIRGTGE